MSKTWYYHWPNFEILFVFIFSAVEVGRFLTDCKYKSLTLNFCKKAPYNRSQLNYIRN